MILNSKVFPKYICYILKSKTELLNSLGSGATFKELSGGKLKQIKIPLPPLEVQKEVVAEIEEEKKIVEANKRLIKIQQTKISQKINELWKQN